MENLYFICILARKIKKKYKKIVHNTPPASLPTSMFRD